MTSQKTALALKGNNSDSISAENLLLVQYRYWMMGHATHKTCYWDRAWEVLCRTITTEKAKHLFADLHFFTRLLCEQTARDLSWHQTPCHCPCPDESLMLALVRASQNEEEFTEILAASELLGTHKVDCLVAASRATARGLKSCGLILQGGNWQNCSKEPAQRVLH